ncbi:hypothetical protein [Pseudoroseomonas sp. WGS1072]|uniref:hypothetical protein n=1 Tax=Roseomonas sp. WGS1072 TaxID=3366816 RepID=UPI003BF3D5F8
MDRQQRLKRIGLLARRRRGRALGRPIDGILDPADQRRRVAGELVALVIGLGVDRTQQGGGISATA